MKNEEDEHDDFDLDDDVEDFPFIQSKWQDSVETGLTIAWPPIAPRELDLSTQLPQTSIAPLFDGTQWAGTRVWKAAIVALEYLVENDQMNYKSLLELGCGLGVPGMLWYCWKKQQQEQNKNADSTNGSADDKDRIKVVLTDQPDLVSQLDANLKSNFDAKTEHITASPLSWSKEGILELLQNDNDGTTESFDVCLNCDCIYTPLYGRDSWLALGDVLETIAKTSPSTLLVTSVERRNGDGLEEFLERLQNTGAVGEIQKVLTNDEDKHHVIEIYVTRGKTET